MAQTRPYFLIFNDVAHIVEAPNAAAAVQHVVGAAVTELRPARPAEVAGWMRAGKALPIAGARRAVTPREPALPDGAYLQFDASDARTWVIAAAGGLDSGEMALEIFDRIRARGAMTLDQFDMMREALPAFAEAICQHGAAEPAENVDQVRASLEGQPMSLHDVVLAISHLRGVTIGRDVGLAPAE